MEHHLNYVEYERSPRLLPIIGFVTEKKKHFNVLPEKNISIILFLYLENIVLSPFIKHFNGSWVIFQLIFLTYIKSKIVKFNYIIYVYTF